MIQPEDMPEIKFAESTVVDALEQYVDVLLDALATVTEQPGIRCAFVSDMSSVSNFLDSEPTGEYSYSKLHDAEVESYTADTEANRKLVAEVAKRIGVPVEVYDYIYDVALRLKKKDEA